MLHIRYFENRKPGSAFSRHLAAEFESTSRLPDAASVFRPARGGNNGPQSAKRFTFDTAEANLFIFPDVIPLIKYILLS